MKPRYVLYSRRNGYYTGKCYKCKGAFDDVEDYPIFTDNIEKAKHYTSLKRAQFFIKRFELRNPFDYGWIIGEVKL